MATSYFTRTPSSAGNRKTFTWSAWVKRANLGSSQRLFSASSSSSVACIFGFNPSDVFQVIDESISYTLSTSQVFRDTSAWYHIVVAVDTTQATASNRLKLYVNGSQISNFTTETYPSQNSDGFINNNIVHTVGSRYQTGTGSSEYFDGCMTHVHFIDGTQYAASDFGETNSTTGIWEPLVNPSVTYGTNGFFLKFENSGSLGTDSSGNGNNFSVGGGTPTQTLDTPTNNFCTINPLTNLGSGSLTMGALRVESGNDMQGTFGVTKGRWYWECTRSNSTQTFHCGITSSFSHYSSGQFVSGSSLVGTILIRDNPANDQFTQNGGGISSISTVTDNNTGVSQGAIVGHYLDLESSQKSFTMYVNNSLAQKYNFNYDGETPVYPAIRMNTGCIGAWNFGNGYFGTTAVSSSNADANGLGLFEYSPTLSGVNYYALCSENLASLG